MSAEFQINPTVIGFIGLSAFQHFNLTPIDLERLVIYIPKTKAGAREQPITASLGKYLETYVAKLQPGVQWLFPSPGAKEGRTVNLDKPFRRCVLAAGLDVKQVVRHTLRHGEYWPFGSTPGVSDPTYR